MKDQTRIILQHENSIHHLKSENETLRAANASLNQRVSLEIDLLVIKIFFWQTISREKQDNSSKYFFIFLHTTGVRLISVLD